MTRQKDLRVWALGRAGRHYTPFRYRVWRVWRLLPKSNNPEHKHGPRGTHVPRHDLALIFTWDQLYLSRSFPRRHMYAYRTYLPWVRDNLSDILFYSGSGYEYLTHIYENYKIFYGLTSRDLIVDCSKYLPKWWGKFICVKNNRRFAGLQNGSPFYTIWNTIVGVACFEIRYNEDRIFVFTDLRYYLNLVYMVVGNMKPRDYMEYAYQEFDVSYGLLTDRHKQIFTRQRKVQIDNAQDDFWPLGK